MSNFSKIFVYLPYKCMVLGIKNLNETKRENLSLIIKRDYLDNKRIIITTNFIMEQLKQVDERIKSRVSEMSEILFFNGKDYRIKMDWKNVEI